MEKYTKKCVPTLIPQDPPPEMSRINVTFQKRERLGLLKVGFDPGAAWIA